MMKIRNFFAGLLAVTLGFPAVCQADDIDIYQGLGSSGTPNVLLVLDNAANFSSSAAGASCIIDGTATALSGTVGGIEQCALYNVVKALPTNSDGTAMINLGIMVYNANNIRDVNNQNCGGTNGGCLMYPLTAMTAANKTAFLAWVKTWKTTGGAGDGYIKANGEAAAATMQEAWAYYKGDTGLSGRSYSGIKPTSGCQKNYVIFVGNSYTSSGTPGDGGSVSPKSALESAPGVTASQKALILNTQTTTCGSFTFPSGSSVHENGGYYADEWARYMYESDLYSDFNGLQNIITYTIGVLGPSCQAEYAGTLQSMADVAGGKYYPTTNYNDLVIAITSILNEVQAVNSVFSSSSLPVSVNAQGTYLNQVFMGMFRPDASASPRWLGNLKQYQFIKDANGNLILGDNDNPPKAAISASGTGFLSPNAISFWTSKNTATQPDSTGGFWVNAQAGAGGGYDSPDGELVEKGGAAQQLRLATLKTNYTTTPSSPRNLYTYCPSGTSCVAQLSNSANAFATTNAAITTAVLGGSTPLSVTSLTRSGTTATVTTASNHGFSTGDSITICCADQAQYNGKFAITKTGATTFTYTVPEFPPTPATGTYTASTPGGAKAVTSLTRAAGTPQATATATVAGHGYSVGQTVTIANASDSSYNGPQVVTAVTANTFDFIITESPLSPGSGGQAWVGTSCTTTGHSANCVNINTILRNGTSVMMTSTGTLPSSFTVGSTVKVSGATPSAYDSSTGYKITGLGTSCSITQQTWNGTAFVSATTTGTNNKSFCFTTFPSASVTPSTGGNGAVIGSTTADSGALSATITSLTRSGSTVTATMAANPFPNGASVSIGGTPAANETGYIGTFTTTKLSNTQLQYTITTTPVTPATGTITASSVAAIDRTALINWVRGEDNVGDESSPGNPYTVRPSIHGDVLHSRPVVINYGGTTGVVAFYGANDGVFRAVNGNQSSAIGTVPAGGELWGLIPSEFFGKLNRLRDNKPELLLPNTPTGIVPTPQPKDYFVDGATGVYQKLKADGTTDTAYLYLTMRRGGRFIYALNVSTPTSPSVLWKISNASTGFSELGQTWSRPRVALLRAYTQTDPVTNAVTSKPVLIFGAGYDTAEDAEPPTADTMGRGIFVVDAITGDLVWRATGTNSACPSGATCVVVSGMDYAIPSDITMLDRDLDGMTDRLYATDVGGNVWRVDIDDASKSNWKVTKLAAVGCSTGVCASGTTPRKFFFPPSVVPIGVAGTTGSYDAVMVPSGDREHPLISTATASAYKVTNRFYMLKDTETGKDGSNLTTIKEANLFDATNAAYDGSLSGFYITFATGEKGVNAPLTQGGLTFFGTNQPVTPDPHTCTGNLGVARGYNVNFITGAYTSTVLDGGGLPPSPVAGIVNVSQSTGEQKYFCIGCVPPPCDPTKDPSCRKCNSALENCGLVKEGAKKLNRTYWYKK